jgi:MFS family permease
MDLPAARPRIPAAIWALGFVSMLMDISSEMIHALLPVYLVTVLGASMLAVGVIEGVAEATANFTKLLSGTLSDWMGRRKPLATLGYALSTGSKPIFALANSVGWVMVARFTDRVGKGVRGAPRDALLADLSPGELRGASFGLRQSLDTVGAFLGPLAAITLMSVTGGAFRAVFWIALIPAALAVGLLVFGVQEPEHPRGESGDRKPLGLRDVQRLGTRFWVVTAVCAFLTLARFSEAFLVLRAQDVGLRVALVPLVMVVMNVVYALSAYPAGHLSDRVGRPVVVSVGIAFLLVADFVLGFGETIALTLVGVAAWGLHMGLTQGLFATLVADTSPADLRGSAFGLFNLVMGMMMLAASVVAGALWGAFGPRATFLVGAGLTLVALLGFMIMFGRHSRATSRSVSTRASRTSHDDQ